MSDREKIQKIAKEVIKGFDVEKDMRTKLWALGLDSLDKFALMADIESECNVLIPSILEDKISCLDDMVLVVENLKRTTKVKGMFVPCAVNKGERCSLLSRGNVFVGHSDVAPETRFCRAFACRKFVSKQR